MVGIVSYGTYIPSYRVRVADIAAAWKKNPDEVTGSLGVAEKSVPAIDEDAVTIALEAALKVFVSEKNASRFKNFQCKPSDIEALFVGSESHPYAVNPTSTIVGELLGVGNNYLAADLEFACKAGTAGLQAIAGLIASGQISYGLAIGADTAQSKPHDVLEYTSAAAGVAFLLGSERFPESAAGATRFRESPIIANLLSYTSYSSDTPDFWRRDGIRYPSHAGRFTGEPAYFAHVVGAARRLMEKTKVRPENVNYCVFHMPNGKFPRDVARRLGFTGEQLAPSLTVDHVGNPYSASSLLGLAAVLDIAKPGQTIFMVSYGSGAGSDGFLWEVTKEAVSYQRSPSGIGTRAVRQKKTVNDQIQRKMYVDYLGYLKQTHKL